jgi:TolB protein
MAQTSPPLAPDERLLGDLIITGTQVQHITKLAVLRSDSPVYEDVVVRSVVRHDLELSGMFDVIPDSKAPPGNYEFEDPVDLPAWQKLGAEVIVKVAARKAQDGKVEIFSLAYFLDVGKDPVYQRRVNVGTNDVRIAAHRVTDALLAAITGRPGSFASHFCMSTPWGSARRVLVMDADGEGLTPVSDPDDTSIAPFWGSNNTLYFTQSVEFSPFHLMALKGNRLERVNLPYSTSVYAASFSSDGQKLAMAAAEDGRSNIYVGSADGTGFNKVSSSEIATSPVFSSNGELAWIAGGARQGGQRVYVNGKPISPNGFTAASPTFCDTENGTRLVYAVTVGNGRMDLVMSDDHGRGMVRLTQGQGSNLAPACSPDGRLLAFFSTRKSGPGLYFLSLKSFKSSLVSPQVGEYLNWARLPDNSVAQALRVRATSKPAPPAQVTPQLSGSVPPKP